MTQQLQADQAQSQHDAAVPDGLRATVARFAAPIRSKTRLQLGTTIGLFLAGCAGMYWAYPFSYLLTLALSLPTAGLLVRVFIVQHDCGHGSLFRSRRANDFVGTLCSLFTLTPYAAWRRHHALHHANWNNLDRRLSGSDIYSACATVREYRALRPWHRFLYRLTRHPLVANVLVPPFVFLALYRFPFDTPRTWRFERRAVWLTDLAIAALVVTAGMLLGFREVFLVQTPILVVASTIGVTLFTLQHRFEGAQWMRQPNWNATTAALHGSSRLKLPRVLQWFTGNIGFHHVHHLDPRVPNYRLEECCDAVPALSAVPALTLRSGFGALWLSLWDEEEGRMTNARGLREKQAATAGAILVKEKSAS